MKLLENLKTSIRNNLGKTACVFALTLSLGLTSGLSHLIVYYLIEG